MKGVILTKSFVRLLKPLLKNYPDMKDSILKICQNFDVIEKIYLYGGIYKIRIRSLCFNKGKSKSFRLILWSWIDEDKIVPLFIYYKGHMENVSKTEIYFHENRALMDIEKGDYTEFIV